MSFWYIVNYYTGECYNSTVKITTENNEQIKNDFILKGDFILNSINYKLYEFHLSSGLSLDASVTINVTK